jgi:Zn ribbon nucleic-acid-binding protein
MLHRPPRQWDRFQVELLPGHHVPLIGTEETMQAFCEDNVINVECSSCQMFLYCKRTAEMVMCPGCRMISPIDEGLGGEGLGLGLSVAAAFEMLEP